jgi:hypothetical protein
VLHALGKIAQRISTSSSRLSVPHIHHRLTFLLRVRQPEPTARETPNLMWRALLVCVSFYCWPRPILFVVHGAKTMEWRRRSEVEAMLAPDWFSSLTE